LPCVPKVPPAGFGYPLGGVSLPQPLEASFSSRRSWGSPFRAFLLLDDRAGKFPIPSSALALLHQTVPAWCRSPSGLLPPKKPCPLLLPWGFSPGRGLPALLGLQTFRALPPRKPDPRRLSSGRPFRSSNELASRPTHRGTLGVQAFTAWLFPSEKGAGPFGLSHRRSSATF
jgi:hypothetical protein